jgi:putative membrane protein
MFVDFLAFQEVTLLMAAVLVGYVSVLGYVAMRRNDASALKGTLKSGAVPIGSLGVIATTLAIWGEIAWPLPGSYNILFTDVYLLFGLTLVVLAVSMATTQKLQYVGLFAFVAGGVTIAYGWSGYHLGMTKEPLETFLLYGAFGLTAILAFPATLAVDHFLAHPDGTAFATRAPTAVARRRPSLQGAVRAAQPIVPETTSGTPDPELTLRERFHVPVYVSATLLVFVAVVALAAIAALFYLDSTLPAHLAAAP